MPSGKKSPCCMYISLVQLADTIYLKLYKFYNNFVCFRKLFCVCSFSNSILYFYYVIVGLSLFMHLL